MKKFIIDYLKKFIETIIGMFVAGIIFYLLACFIRFEFIEINIDWVAIRISLISSSICALWFLSRDYGCWY